MTATVTTPTVTSAPVVVQLAIAEGRRLVRHPLVLGGLALSLVGTVAAALTSGEHAGDLAFMILSGGGQWPLAVGTFLATNVAAVRGRRHGTLELEDTTVTGAAPRTVGVITAAAVPAILAAALLVTGYVLLGAADGIRLRFPDGFVERPMHPVELAQGPLVVGVMAVLGVAFGRWIPSRLIGPLMLIPAVIGFFHATWRFDSTAWRFAPVMAHERQVGWVQVTPGSGYSVLDGFAIGDLAWHLVYLVGLGVLLGAVAVARSVPSSRRVRGIALAGLSLAAVGGLLQLP